MSGMYPDLDHGSNMEDGSSDSAAAAAAVSTSISPSGDIRFNETLLELISNVDDLSPPDDSNEASAPGMEGYWHVFALSERCTGCSAVISGRPGFVVSTFPCGHAKCQKCLTYEDIFPTNGKIVCPIECDWRPAAPPSEVPGTAVSGGHVSSRPNTRPVEILAENARIAAAKMQRELDASGEGRSSATAGMNEFATLAYNIEQAWNKDNSSALPVTKWLSLLRPYGKMGIDAARMDRSFDTLKGLEVAMQEKHDIQAASTVDTMSTKEKMGAMFTGVRRLVIADADGEVGEDEEEEASGADPTPPPIIRAWFKCDGVKDRLSLDAFIKKGINVADLKYGLRVDPEELVHLGLGPEHMSSKGTPSDMEDARAPYELGYRVATLRGMWSLTNDEFKKSGLTLDVAKTHGYTVEDLDATGFDFDHMLHAGFVFSDFKRFRVSPMGAKKLGFTKPLFEQVNMADGEILDCGWAPDDIRRTYEVSDDWFRRHDIPYSTGTELRPAGEIRGRVDAAKTKRRRLTKKVALKEGSDRRRSSPRHLESDSSSNDDLLEYLDSDEEDDVREAPRRRGLRSRSVTADERAIAKALSAAEV